MTPSTPKEMAKAIIVGIDYLATVLKQYDGLPHDFAHNFAHRHHAKAGSDVWTFLSHKVPELEHKILQLEEKLLVERQRRPTE